MKRESLNTNPSRPLPFVKGKGWWMVLLLILLTGCGKATPSETDTDPCAGRCGTVAGVVCGSCNYGFTCNVEQFCVEIPGNDVDYPPQDTLLSDTALPDIDTFDPNCPNLKVYANVKKAGFPLKDRNGKLTFCRPGCETPTENDPQCVRNLWDWINWGRSQEPEFKECYPWPCIHKDIKAAPLTHPCDRMLSSFYITSTGTIWDLKVRNNKIGLYMGRNDYKKAPSHRAIAYNIVKDQYTTIGYAPQSNYDYGRFIITALAEDLYDDQKTHRYYVISAKEKEDGSYHYEVIYNSPDYREWFNAPPFIGKTWVVLQLIHRDTGAARILYARTDDWQWQEYSGNTMLYEGNLVGNTLTYLNSKREVYVCDLSKTPKQKSDCLRIDREGEIIYAPRLDEENPSLLYYYDDGKPYITQVNLTTTPLSYTQLPYQPSEQNPQGADPMQIKGNLLHYNESFMNGDRTDYKACMYRIDQQKSYCPHTYVDVYGPRYDMGYNSWDGDYQVWKIPSGTVAAMRDMACYCEKEGVCPLNDNKVKELIPGRKNK